MRNIPRTLRLTLARAGNRAGVRDLDLPLHLRRQLGPVIDAIAAGDSPRERALLEILDDEALSFLADGWRPLRMPVDEQRWSFSATHAIDFEAEVRRGRESSPWPVLHDEPWAPTGFAGHERTLHLDVATDPTWSLCDPAVLTARRAEPALALVDRLPELGAEGVLDELALLEFEEVEAALAHLPHRPETHILFGLPTTPLELLGLERSLRLGAWYDSFRVFDTTWSLVRAAAERGDGDGADTARFMTALRLVHVQRGYRSAKREDADERIAPLPVELPPGVADEVMLRRSLAQRLDDVLPIREEAIERARAEHPRAARLPERPETAFLHPRLHALWTQRLHGTPPAPTHRQRLWRRLGSTRLTQIGRAQFEEIVRRPGTDPFGFDSDDAICEDGRWIRAVVLACDIVVHERLTAETGDTPEETS